MQVIPLRLPGALIGEDDPVPRVDSLLEARVDLGVELPERIHGTAATGQPRSLHPYLMQNRYSRERVDIDLDTVVLENEHLRAQFIPQLGGRLWSLTELDSGRELLYRNQVVQPANLALRNAWFAGGVEWNIATKGHSPHTCTPLHAAGVAGPDNVPTLRMWEFERLRGVVYQIDARLPPGARALHVYVRIRNPNDTAVPMYWWSNAAVPERPDVRVVAPATRAYATSYDGTVRSVPVPAHQSVDRTWPTRNTYAADFFFDLGRISRPWIAAVDGSGHGLGQASTARLLGRKLFCWGTGAGGRRWQRWLSPEGGEYLEIQAGLAATQYEHVEMAAGESWSWLEAYGDVAADPVVAHGAHWNAATDHVAARMDRLAAAEPMAAAYEQADAMADRPPGAMICRGSGWGALEREARATTGQGWVDEAGTPFPSDTVGVEQEGWRALLRDDGAAGAALRDAAPQTPPRSYVTGEPWQRLLAGCVESWARDYHLGVMAHAAGDLEAARARYSASVAQQPTAWALHGLAVVAGEENDPGAAAGLLASAVALAPDQPSLVHEAVAAALDAGDGAGALTLVDSASPGVRESGRVRLLEGRAALACGCHDRVAEVLTAGVEVPDLREGETSLSDLWLQLHPDQPVPPEYDFRMR
ncbi:MAG: DUF5107 domain-containing protein [Nocardioidaceae bacterium]|nr:DUF5107 domain-containing protein [Nocardioidaceae bacterium]